MTDDAPAPHDAVPLLHIVRGDPSAEELAALVTVVAALRGGGASPAARRVGGWADRRGMLPTPFPVGPGAWAASGRQPGVRTRAGW